MNASKRFLLSGMSLLIAFGLAACDKSGPAETAGRSIDQAVEKSGDKIANASKLIGEKSDKAGEALGDTAITAKVKAAILAEPDLDVMQINVVTTDGVTTLSGSTSSQLSSDRAKEVASAVAGVKTVKNELMVRAVN